MTIGAALPEAAQSISGFAFPFLSEAASAEATPDFAQDLLDAGALEYLSEDVPSEPGDTDEAPNGVEKSALDISGALPFVIPFPVPAPPQPLMLHLNLDCELDSLERPERAAAASSGLAAPAIFAEPATDAAALQPPPAPAPARSPASRPTPTAPAASREPGDMAFAARIQTDAPVPAPVGTPARTDDATPRVGSAIPSARQPEEFSPQPSGPARDASILFAPTPDVSVPLGREPHAPALNPGSGNAPEPVQAVHTEIRQPKPSGPLRDLSLQLQNAAQERVDVRFSQRGGELHIAVRTPDPDLARGLGQALPELVDRLQETGFRTETWRPGHAVVSATSVSNQPSSSPEFRNADPEHRFGGSQQQHHEQRDSQHFHRPQWVEELEGSLQSAAPQTGDRNGFVR